MRHGRWFGSPTEIASAYLAMQVMNAIPRTPPRKYPAAYYNQPEDAFSYWFPRIVGVIIAAPLIVFLGLLLAAFGM